MASIDKDIRCALNPGNQGKLSVFCNSSRIANRLFATLHPNSKVEGKLLKLSLVHAAAAATVLFAGVTASQDLRAQERHQKMPQEETAIALLTTPLAGIEGKEVHLLHISAPPGFVTPKHTHPGQLFIYVVAGAVTIEADGMAPIKLGPGEAVQEPSGVAMVGKNLSATQSAELIVFQIGDTGQSLEVEAK